MPETKANVLQYLKVFSPSPLGIVLYIAIAVTTIIANQLSSINAYLQLPSNLHVGRQLARLADTVLTSTIGSGKTTTLIVGLFWAGVGIVVYFLLRNLAKIAVELDEHIGATKYVWPKGADRSRPIRRLFARLILQGIAAAVLFVVLFGPLAAALNKPLVADIFSLGSAATFAAWFVSLMLLMHAAVVLARLVVLRPRLLG